eukprot:14302837-Heterocapsa_arctica.AAC.1
MTESHPGQPAGGGGADALDVGPALACAENFEGMSIKWVIDTGSGNHLEGRGELPPALRNASNH